MAKDPFERWREAMAQWSGDETPDPTALGPTGWPMLPFPGPGTAGAEDPLSPAAGTKTAVRQLYRTLDELDAGAGAAEMFTGEGSGGSAPDLWSAYREALGSETSGEGSQAAAAGRGMGSMLVGTYLVWLYSLGQLLLESYAMRLVHDEVVREAHQGTADTLEWLLGLSQTDREELLRRATDVDDDLVDEMAAVRGRRNDHVYNLGRLDAVDLEDPVGDARAYLAVLRALDERATEGEAFHYLPEDGGGAEADSATGGDEDSASGGDESAAGDEN